METPESVEDVMVEADGEWHTSDNKFASEGWKTSHPLPNGVVRPVSPKKEPETPAPISSPSLKAPNGRALPEVISLTDSEDDEERIVKRELSPKSGYTSQSHSFASSGGKSGRTPPPPSSKASFSNEVIDLTLDSDEDDLPSTYDSVHKRKERGLDDSPEASSSWKKPRYCAPSSSGSGSGSGSSSSGYGSYPNSAGTSSVASGVGIGLNGKSHSTYGEVALPGTNSWGPVRIPLPAPPQSAYQVPLSHAPSSSGMPVHSQNMNVSYPNYGSVGPRSSMDMAMSRSVPMVPYFNSQYGLTPPGHNRGEAL